jgi:hypothetical protein
MLHLLFASGIGLLLGVFIGLLVMAVIAIFDPWDVLERHAAQPSAGSASSPPDYLRLLGQRSPAAPGAPLRGRSSQGDSR